MSIERPHPPGRYPVVVVGSGPGALQVSYFLTRLGIDAAVVSRDAEPAGMFRRFPLFDRLITWTKPFAPAAPGTREYEWYDWNSLLAEEPGARSLVPELMDGTSYFPARMEMQRGIELFAERTAARVRYGCAWRGTRRDGADFVLETDDGEYRCAVAVFALGMTEPWTPAIPGIDEVPHYVDTREAKEYVGRRVVVIGKRNSGFEVADGLLPWARQIVLASPRPARVSVVARSTAATRARYLQPYEDHVLGGGTFVLDAAIERIERGADGWRVHTNGTTHPGSITLECDDLIAATGFRTPLLDLPDLGVATFYQGGRLPAQTPYWESPTVPGIYFAGNVTQGSLGLRKHGMPSNSAAVHGFRYNARVLARHIAEKHFGAVSPPSEIRPDEVVPFLLREATGAPELWNQQSYLARAVWFEPGGRVLDRGIVPLAHFVDEAGPDAVAMTIESDPEGEIHPTVYVRRAGKVSEHALDPDPLHRFASEAHARQLAAVMDGLAEGV